MPKEELKKLPDKRKPPTSAETIGKHKSMEMDSLEPTPDRKAKTGKKS
jgi:hypothetical protein